jgi:hypothetical protein
LRLRLRLRLIECEKYMGILFAKQWSIDILTGDMLLRLSHTDVCSASDEQSGVAVER